MFKVTVLFMCVTAAFGWKAVSTINTNLEALKPVRVVLNDGWGDGEGIGAGRIGDIGIRGLDGIGGIGDLRGGIGIGKGIGLEGGIGIGRGIGGLGRLDDYEIGRDIGIGRGIGDGYGRGGGAVSWGRIDRGGKGW